MKLEGSFLPSLIVCKQAVSKSVFFLMQSAALGKKNLLINLTSEE